VSYSNSSSLVDAIAEEVFNHIDFSSSVESVIDDYDMDDKITDALKDHDFGVGDLEEKADNVINRMETLESEGLTMHVRICALEEEAMVQLKLIEGLTKRIEQLEAETASVNWDELLNL
jgi:hypothetical protein